MVSDSYQTSYVWLVSPQNKKTAISFDVMSPVAMVTTGGYSALKIALILLKLTHIHHIFIQNIKNIFLKWFYPSGHLVPSPILGLANAPIVETKFLELAMSLLDFSPRIPLGTFSILLYGFKYLILILIKSTFILENFLLSYAAAWQSWLNLAFFQFCKICWNLVVFWWYHKNCTPVRTKMCILSENLDILL